MFSASREESVRNVHEPAKRACRSGVRCRTNAQQVR